jgi:type II secretory pathway pseudopilin PulG
VRQERRVVLTGPSSGREESGFTLVELAITMMVGTIVMISLLGLLTSQSKAERRLNDFVGNQESARLALVEMQQDLRSAEPLAPLADPSEYPARVQIVNVDFTTGARTQFQWRLDTVNKQLVRETLDTSGNVTGTTYRLKGVNDTAAFEYFDAKGYEYLTVLPNPNPGNLALDPSSTIARCTVRMRITLHGAPNRGPAPTLASSDVEMRNRLPGDSRC